MVMKPSFTFKRISVRREKEVFAVAAIHADGTSSHVGNIIHFWIRHLEMMGWEAVGLDGHRAVHKFRDQAAMALIWDGTGYPFPLARS